MTPEHTHENHGEDWSGIYDAEQVWSGNPNDALVTTMNGSLRDLTPGRAVDLGCGEGADAVWLAQQGWDVVAVDVSEAAVGRGRAAAERTGNGVAERIDWRVADVAQAGLEPGSFALVGAFYPALRRKPDHQVEHFLASLVAPNGVLLFVHHAEVDRETALAHGFDPDDYVSADDLVAFLGDGWSVDRSESERHVTEGRGAHHSRDVVVIARRVA